MLTAKGNDKVKPSCGRGHNLACTYHICNPWMTPAVVSPGICFAKSQGCQFLDICLVDIATGYFHFIGLFALDLVVQKYLIIL